MNGLGTRCYSEPAIGAAQRLSSPNNCHHEESIRVPNVLEIVIFCTNLRHVSGQEPCQAVIGVWE